jgi:hypothetical protein
VGSVRKMACMSNFSIAKTSNSRGRTFTRMYDQVTKGAPWVNYVTRAVMGAINNT